MSKTLKDIVKKNIAPAAKPLGVNPSDPWSAKAKITEASLLDKYLSARGINPQFVSTNTKVSHAKSTQFMKWKQDHMQKEDITTKKDDGDARSKEIHSPTRRRETELKKAAQHYKIKPVTTHKESPNQMTALTPVGEEVTKKPKMTALDKFRKASEKRAAKHKEIAKKSGGMTVAIDRLEKHLNKEDLQLETKRMSAAIKLARALDRERQRSDASRVRADKLLNPPKSPEKVKEDVGDAKAAVNADGLPNPQLEPVSERKKQMSKSARMIKALYKKKGVTEDSTAHDCKHCNGKGYNTATKKDGTKVATNCPQCKGKGYIVTKGVVKEELHDHEKEDKSIATYGKKPKFEKSDKDEGGEKKPQAAATLTGGTTLTGEKRDDIEIDPMMRNRPGQPDVTKKDDKKKDGKEDKKKDK